MPNDKNEARDTPEKGSPPPKKLELVGPPALPTDKEKERAKTEELQRRGLLPVVDVTDGSTELKKGDIVHYSNENWKVQGNLDGKVVLFQKGRGETFAGLFQFLDGAPDPSTYKEIKIDGSEPGSRYYVDKKGHVFRLTEVGEGRFMFGSAHDVQLVEQASVHRQKGPSVGDKVRYKGESLKVGGLHGDHALLYETGRRSTDAMVMHQVTDKELNSKYQAVKVTIDGEESVRYLDKANPERGVYQLLEFGGRKSIGPDHQFEVAKTSELPSRLEPLKQSEQKKSEAKTNEPTKIEKSQPKEKVAEKAADLRKADKHKTWGEMEERSRTIDGAEVKVRSPTEKYRRIFREVEIDGKKIELQNRPFTGQQWYYSDEGKGADKTNQVKLHVTGIAPEDVAKLQKELLPVLEEMRKNGDVSHYKTFDPNFMDANWNEHPDRIGTAPGPTGQDSKAFTVYLPPEKAEQVSKAIDKLLAEKGLKLNDHKSATVGDSSRLKTASQRVSIERDHWPVSESEIGQQGALLDADLSKKLTEKYKGIGTESDGRLTTEALRQIEKDTGVKKGQLMYDKDGRLMFVSDDRSGSKGDGLYYADEYTANKEKGSLTGRPALYALYESGGLDPAQMHLQEERVRHEALAKTGAQPAREVPVADRLKDVDARAGRDGTIERREVRPGEALAREQLEKRERVDAKEIENMKRLCSALEKSQNEEERRRAEGLRRTIEALEGRLGPEVEHLAHRAVLEESRRMIERGEGGGYGKAIAGGLIGVGILSAAAIAWYRSGLKSDEKKLQRAKTSGR